MKIKSDFVTNSSSTSFILRCKADSKDELIDKVNSVLKDYIKDSEWNDQDFEAPPLLTSEKVYKTDSGQFIITDKIYLNVKEMPQWINDLFIDNNSDARKKLDSVGIKLISVDFKNSE